MKQGKEVVMALSQRERAYLEGQIRQIEHDIKNKEDILDSYKQNPSMKRYIPGLEHEITGLKRSLESYRDALRKG